MSEIESGDPQHPFELAVIRRAHAMLGQTCEADHPGSEVAYLALGKFLRQFESKVPPPIESYRVETQHPKRGD